MHDYKFVGIYNGKAYNIAPAREPFDWNHPFELGSIAKGMMHNREGINVPDGSAFHHLFEKIEIRCTHTDLVYAQTDGSYLWVR